MINPSIISQFLILVSAIAISAVPVATSNTLFGFKDLEISTICFFQFLCRPKVMRLFYEIILFINRVKHYSYLIFHPKKSGL